MVFGFISLQHIDLVQGGSKTAFVPHCVEASAGLDRGMFQSHAALNLFFIVEALFLFTSIGSVVLLHVFHSP